MSREIYEELSKETLLLLAKEIGFEVHDDTSKEALVDGFLVDENLYRTIYSNELGFIPNTSYALKAHFEENPYRVETTEQQEKKRKALQELILTFDRGRERDRSTCSVIIREILNMQNSLSEIYTALSNRK